MLKCPKCEGTGDFQVEYTVSCGGSVTGDMDTDAIASYGDERIAEAVLASGFILEDDTPVECDNGRCCFAGTYKEFFYEGAE